MIMRRRTLRSFLTAIFAVTILLLLAGAACALDNGQCLDCHGDQGILGWSPAEKASNVTPGGPKAEPISWEISRGCPSSSTRELQGLGARGPLLHRLPRRPQGSAAQRRRLKPVDCSGCHSKEAATYAKSNHVVAFGGKPIDDPPRCVDCHGAHAVPKSSVSTSPVYFRNIAATCTRCHGNGTITENQEHRHPGGGQGCTQRASTTGPSSNWG